MLRGLVRHLVCCFMMLVIVDDRIRNSNAFGLHRKSESYIT